jgi:hypothetical protein
MVKLPIRWHKVAKTLIDNGTSLNLIMRKTFIKMDLNLSDLALVHGTFHNVIPGQPSTPIGRINLEVSCGSRDHKHRETLTFKVPSFNIGYKCILGGPFLLMFMVVSHTPYATMMMPGPKGMITIKVDQSYALACKNASLWNVGCFRDKTTPEQVAMAAKTQGGNVPHNISASKLPTNSILWVAAETIVQKGVNIASVSTQLPTIQKVDDKKKGTAAHEDNKENLADTNNPDKKLRISSNLDSK